MSDEEGTTGEEYITPELRGGHLQIVELTPIDMGEGIQGEGYEYGEGSELAEGGEFEREMGDEEGIEMLEGGEIGEEEGNEMLDGGEMGDEEENEMLEGGEIGDEEGIEMLEGGQTGDGNMCVGVEMFEGEEDETEEAESDMKFMQVMDPSGKELMQLDLLNFTLVRCEDGDERYKLVANSELQEVSDTAELPDLDPDNATVTYVMANDGDGEDQEADMSKTYVVLDGEQHEQEQDSYVMVESQDGPIVFLQSELKPIKRNKPALVTPEKTEKKAPTTLELLEKAKVVNKAKKLLKAFERPETSPRGRGRPRKYDFPEANELLSSPSFKLFLYTCKLCDYKCNATKELTAHKEKEHGNWAIKYRTQYRLGTNILALRKDQRQAQCPHCPYRDISRVELEKHIQKSHKKLLAQQKIGLETAVKHEIVEIKKELLKAEKNNKQTSNTDDDDEIQNIIILENTDKMYFCGEQST